jgi:hypothetical protein
MQRVSPRAEEPTFSNLQNRGVSPSPRMTDLVSTVAAYVRNKASYKERRRTVYDDQEDDCASTSRPLLADHIDRAGHFDRTATVLVDGSAQYEGTHEGSSMWHQGSAHHAQAVWGSSLSYGPRGGLATLKSNIKAITNNAREELDTACDTSDLGTSF